MRHPAIRLAAIAVFSALLPAQAWEYEGYLQGSDWTPEAADATHVRVGHFAGGDRYDAVALLGDELVFGFDPMDHDEFTVIGTGVADFVVVADPDGSGTDILLTAESDGVFEWRWQNEGLAREPAAVVGGDWGYATKLHPASWRAGAPIGVIGIDPVNDTILGLEWDGGWIERSPLTLSGASTLIEARTVERTVGLVEIAVLTATGLDIWDPSPQLRFRQQSSGVGELLDIVPSTEERGGRVIWIGCLPGQQWFFEIDEAGPYTVHSLGATDFRDIGLVDFNGDGWLDVFLADPVEAWLLTDLGPDVPAPRYVFDLSTTSHFDLEMPFYSSGDPQPAGPYRSGLIDVADLDGDGDQDVLYGHQDRGIWIVGGDHVEEHDPRRWIELDYDESWALPLPANGTALLQLDVDFTVPAAGWSIPANPTHIHLQTYKQDNLQVLMETAPIHDLLVPIPGGGVDPQQTLFFTVPSDHSELQLLFKLTLVDSGAPAHTPASIYSFATNKPMKELIRSWLYSLPIFGYPFNDEGSGFTPRNKLNRSK